MTIKEQNGLNGVDKKSGKAALNDRNCYNSLLDNEW